MSLSFDLPDEARRTVGHHANELDSVDCTGYNDALTW